MSRAEPSRAEPSRAEPSRAVPSRAVPRRFAFGGIFDKRGGKPAQQTHRKRISCCGADIGRAGSKAIWCRGDQLGRCRHARRRRSKQRCKRKRRNTRMRTLTFLSTSSSAREVKRSRGGFVGCRPRESTLGGFLTTIFRRHLHDVEVAEAEVENSGSNCSLDNESDIGDPTESRVATTATHTHNPGTPKEGGVRRGRRAGGVSPASATMAEVELRRRIRHRRWLRRQRNPVSSQGGAMPHREERRSDPQVRYMGQNVRSLKSVERQSDDFSRTYDMFWCISCGAQTKTMEVVTSFRAASIVIL